MEEEKVTITGEVRFPGEYVIMPGEQLSSLIARAGGLMIPPIPRPQSSKVRSLKSSNLIQAKQYLDNVKSRVIQRMMVRP